MTPGERAEQRIKDPARLEVHAVREEMATPEHAGVVYQLVDGQPHRRVVGGDDRAGADSHDDLERDAASGQPAQNTQVRGAAQAASREDETNPR